MTALPPRDLSRLPGDWWEVEADQAEELISELARELPEGHVLHGEAVQPVAVRRHLKDVVFWVPARGQWAWVHLTETVEHDPQWPATFCAEQWAEVVAEMQA